MSIDPWSADLTIAEITAARRRNRRRIGQLTAPLWALAALLVCSAMWVLVAGRDRLAAFYAPGLLVVAIVSGRRARRDAAAVGVQVKVWPWVATAVLLLMLSATVSRWAATHHTAVEEVGPAIVFAAGISAFGLWARSMPVAVAGAATVAVSLVATTLAAGDTCVALQLIAYAGLLVLAARSVKPRLSG